jgi:hypothetical protein
MTGAKNAGYASLATSSWGAAKVPGMQKTSSHRAAKSDVGALSIVSIPLISDAE